MNKKKFLTAALIVTGSLALFQNCSQVQYQTVESSFIVPKQCFDLKSEDVTPTLKWSWSEQTNNKTLAMDFNQVMSAPVVGDLNNDGLPEVVVNMFTILQSNHFSDVTYSAHHGRNGALRIISGKTGETLFTAHGQDVAPAGHTSPLLVDLDGDNKLEIVYTHYSYKKIIALNFDGSFRWKYDLNTAMGSCIEGLSSLNLYPEPGNEILVGNRILNEVNGLPRLIQTISGMSAGLCSGFAMSLDASRPNEKQIISSSGVFDSNGSRIHSNTYGLVVAADIDKTTKDLEIVSVGSGIVTMNNGITGQQLFKTNLNTIGDLKCTNRTTVGGGPPTVGNFDENPNTTEIAIATGRYLIILNERGNLIDKFETQDCSSQTTGITAFDFNGDLLPEILYGDEEYLRVLEIRNGQLTEVFKIVNPSGTLREYPIVVDLDGNLSAELLVVSNNYAARGLYKGANEVADKTKALAITGIRAFEPKTVNAWMPTRSSWNQFHFSHGMFDGKNNLLSNTAVDGSLSSFRNNIQLGIDQSLCNPK